MTGWRKRTIMEMAREAWAKAGEGWVVDAWFDDRAKAFEAFAELVRADERSRTWTQDRWTEYEHNIAAQEREACAKVCEDNATDLSEGDWDSACINCAHHIRSRGEA